MNRIDDVFLNGIKEGSQKIIIGKAKPSVLSWTPATYVNYYKVSILYRDSNGDLQEYFVANQIFSNQLEIDPDILIKYYPNILTEYVGVDINIHVVHSTEPFSRGVDFYSVKCNSAPVNPNSIIISDSIFGGESTSIIWPASIDPDGNIEGYIVERSYNGGLSWEQVYQGRSTSTSISVPFGTQTIMFRVQAYDTYGEKSG